MPKAAGVLLLDDEGRVLLLKRAASARDHPETWGLPGGHIEDGEMPEAAARRETCEEIGLAYHGPLVPLWETQDGFRCYGAALDEDLAQFDPQLNDEHTAAKWAALNDLPAPLHPSLAKELRKVPLEKGSSKTAFSHNVEAEVAAGKPQKQAVAIAYHEAGEDCAFDSSASCAELHKLAEWFLAQGQK